MFDHRNNSTSIGKNQTYNHKESKNEMVRVGERNVEATKKKLAQLKIPILAEDTGKNYGRTVIFYPETGDFVIRAVGKQEYSI